MASGIRPNHSYDAPSRSPTRARCAYRGYGISSRRGGAKLSCSASPQKYPVSRVNGVMVSCFLTPDTERSQYTYPPELKSEIERVVGRYMVDV